MKAIKPSQASRTTVSQILADFAERLFRAGNRNAVLESELMVSDALALPRLELFFQKKRLLDCAELQKIRNWISRRIRHEPLQYIIGKAYFRNICLSVRPGVLIPRMETEQLVEIALQMAPRNAEVLDVGTGSGAIALSMAHERPDLKLTATDISLKALAIARKNKKDSKIKNARFIRGNIFSPFSRSKKKFSLITANLPYISAEAYKKLPWEIRRHEPSNALVAGAEGLKYIRPLIIKAHRHLLPGASAILEISPEQKKRLEQIARSTGKYRSVEFKKDYYGKTRFCILAV